MSSYNEILNKVVEPVIIVDKFEKDRVRHFVHLTALDEFLKDPRIWGIVMSDLIEDIASVYAQNTGLTLQEAQEAIMDTLVDENNAKAADPNHNPSDITTVVIGKPRMN